MVNKSKLAKEVSRKIFIYPFFTRNLKMNKRAWIRIVESFFAILLIAGILLVVLDTYYSDDDISEDIYIFQEGVLNGVKINSDLRTGILSVPLENLPVEWEYIQNEESLNSLENYLVERVPDYLDCEFIICDVSSICVLNKSVERELFGKSTILSAEGALSEPRTLSLFCWVK